MSNIDDTVPALGEVKLPPHLKERLEGDAQRFHHSTSVGEDLAAHTQRHDTLLSSKASAAHAEVEHAKEVARTHTSDPANDARGADADAALREGEQRVESKKNALAAQQAEISDLEARLRRADEVERLLRAKLGEA
ncbi:hypothetical protein JCM10450v2_004831 [Rhodotorula kratochvilovae]